MKSLLTKFYDSYLMLEITGSIQVIADNFEMPNFELNEKIVEACSLIFKSTIKRYGHRSLSKFRCDITTKSPFYNSLRK